MARGWGWMRALRVLVAGLAVVIVGAPAGAQDFDVSRLSVPEEAIASGGPRKDGIPALTDPAVVPAADAAYLRPDDRVLGVALSGDARAYPIRILNWHEVVNDRLAERAIVVTYCALCGTGMVFDATRDGERMEFGVSGLLYNSNALLYDRETESLWSQVKMEAISGARMGDRLRWLPAQHTTWQAWRTRHPETDVLSLWTGHWRDYGRNPYAAYAKMPGIGSPVRHSDARLPSKHWVLGVIVGDQAKAYPLDRLTDGEVLEDLVGGQPLRIHYDASARAAWVTDAAEQLIPSVQAYWFAWAAFYPQTLLWE